MHFLVLLVLQIIISILAGLLFRPKAPKASPVTTPTTDPSTPIPVLFGRALLGGNVIAFLNFRPHLTGNTGIYDYSVAMVMAYCMGPITTLVDIVSDTGLRFSEIPAYNQLASQSGSPITGYTSTYTSTPAASTPGVYQLPIPIANHDVLYGPDFEMTLNAPRLYGDGMTGGGVHGNIHFFPGTREQPESTFWRDFKLPSIPGVAYVVDATGQATITIFTRRDIQSIKWAVSTTAPPTFTTVNSGTLISAPPWGFVYSSLTNGQTLYVGVLAYNALGTPSPLVSFQFTYTGVAASGQPSGTGAAGSTLGDVPRYPNLCYVVYEDTIMGQQSTPRALGFELQRVPSTFSDTLFTIGPQGDVNPISILFELMTDRLWGIGLADSELELTSWNTALATLISEGLFLSYVLASQSAVQEYIDEILRTIDAMFFVDPLLGTLGITLIRGDYTLSALPVFDESNLIDCDYTETTPQETVNEMRVTFTDRARLYDNNQVKCQNTASIYAQGRVVPSTVTYKGVTQETLALKLAQRDLRAVSTPPAKATLLVNRSAFDLHVGMPFKLSWTRANTSVNQKVMRVGKITRAGRNDSQLAVECIADVFAAPVSVAYVTSGVTWDNPSKGMMPTVPTATPVQSQDATLGYLGLQIFDPDSRLVSVSFQEQSGHGTLSAFALATSPYHASVTLDPQYPSLITYLVSYALQDGTLASYTGTATFSVKQAPPVPVLSFTITSGGVVLVTATVASTVTSVKFADSTSAPPSDVTTRAGAAVTGPFTFTPVASPLAAGATDYVTAFAYDAAGNESAKAILTITAPTPGASVSSQPVTIDNETASIAGSRQLQNGTNTTVDTATAGQVKIDLSGTVPSGDLAGSYPGPTLAVIGSATGPIGDATHVPVVTIDAKGRVTALTSAAISAGGGSSGPWAQNTTTTSGLTFGYYGGEIMASGGSLSHIADGTIALTDNATNYVERDETGSVFTNTTGFTASSGTVARIPMAKVTTVSGAITAVVDNRMVAYSDFPDSLAVTVSYTTASIADGTNENGSITIPSSAREAMLEALGTDHTAWVRVYATGAARTADASRPITSDPTPGTGVLADFLPLGATVKCGPPPVQYNGDSPQASTLYIAITNKSGSTSTITATFTFRPL